MLMVYAMALVSVRLSVYPSQVGVPFSTLPLVSEINSRLPSVNHALISLILPHPVL